jgi:hypothetical protein
MRTALAFVILALPVVILGACGETRAPIGDECLRNEDCLSGVCSFRTCVGAPTLVSGTGSTPPDETPRIPVGEGGSGSDAALEGG